LHNEEFISHGTLTPDEPRYRASAKLTNPLVLVSAFMPGGSAEGGDPPEFGTGLPCN